MRFVLILGSSLIFASGLFAQKAKDQTDLIADANWIEGSWKLPVQKVEYAGKTISVIVGAAVTRSFPDQPSGNIRFSLCGSDGKWIENFGPMLNFDLKLIEKKGDRLAQMKDLFAQTEYFAKYERNGKELHLTFDAPLKFKGEKGEIEVNLNGNYQKNPRLVMIPVGNAIKTENERPDILKKLQTKCNLILNETCTHHHSDGTETLPAHRYTTAILLSSDKGKYVIAMSTIDFWSKKSATGGIDTYTHSGAGKVEIPVGKEVTELGFKWYVED